MRKRFLVLGVAAVVLAIITVGCSNVGTFSGKGTGSVFGRVYNGLTREQITGPAAKAATADANLAGTLTYYDAKKNATVTATASFSGDYYYFSKIPTMTPFTMEFSSGTTYQMWSYVNSAGIQENVMSSNLGDTWFLPADPAMLGDVYLFPADVNPGDVTIQITDSKTGAVIDSAGTVLLTPTSNSAYDNGAGGGDPNLLANASAFTLAQKVSGTLAKGSVDIPGTSLVLGATYKIEVYGVAGYSGTVSSSNNFTPMSATASTQTVALTTVTPALALVTRSDFINDGSSTATQVTAGSSITFTFNRDIELDPVDAYTPNLIAVAANPDTNGNGTLNTLVADTASYTSSPQVASKLVTLSVSGNALTVTLATGALATSDTADYFTLSLATNSILLRNKGDTSQYVTLASLLFGAFNTTTWIVQNSAL